MEATPSEIQTDREFSAEYVPLLYLSGELAGDARLDFERQLISDPALREQYEQTVLLLGALNHGVTPTQPMLSSGNERSQPAESVGFNRTRRFAGWGVSLAVTFVVGLIAGRGSVTTPVPQTVVTEPMSSETQAAVATAWYDLQSAQAQVAQSAADAQSAAQWEEAVPEFGNVDPFSALPDNERPLEIPDWLVSAVALQHQPDVDSSASQTPSQAEEGAL